MVHLVGRRVNESAGELADLGKTGGCMGKDFVDMDMDMKYGVTLVYMDGFTDQAESPGSLSRVEELGGACPY